MTIYELLMDEIMDNFGNVTLEGEYYIHCSASFSHFMRKEMISYMKENNNMIIPDGMTLDKIDIRVISFPGVGKITIKEDRNMGYSITKIK